MSKKTNYLFIGLHIVAWVIFVGLCIEAGALIVNFIFSLFKPEIVHNLYQKLDLSDLYSRSKWSYYCMYSFIMVISVLKAYLFYIVIKLLTKFIQTIQQFCIGADYTNQLLHFCNRNPELCCQTISQLFASSWI